MKKLESAIRASERPEDCGVREIIRQLSADRSNHTCGSLPLSTTGDSPSHTAHIRGCVRPWVNQVCYSQSHSTRGNRLVHQSPHFDSIGERGETVCSAESLSRRQAKIPAAWFLFAWAANFLGSSGVSGFSGLPASESRP